jgi:FkbM family methyltransferase
MTASLKHIFRPYINFFKQRLTSPKKLLPIYYRHSYSQEGEDMILARIFEDKSQGFYVDVGAHHPQRLSNTYYFYLKGWHGINIDAMPGSMVTFNEIRSRDINLEIAISNYQKNLTYYGFNEPALNSFSQDIANQYSQLDGYKIVFKKLIKTSTLSEILDEYLPQNQNIDFLNIDVEGMDYEVLKSNDWSKYRPQIVLIEELNSFSIDELSQSKVVSFMQENNYQFYCKTINTLIFKIH